MKPDHRHTILSNCKDGEEIPVPRTRPDTALIQWTLSRLLAVGVSKSGFPYIVWENRDWAAILIGSSRTNQRPQSVIRNDASCRTCSLEDSRSRQNTAERMGKELVY